jgi:serine/threonine protein kinase
LIGKSLAHYEITALLGEGGMGAVYRARDTKLDRDVALKLLPAALVADPERVARFEREAKTLASIQHAHIASIYGFEHDGTHRFLVMELVEGEDLGARIQRGAIPLEEAIQISRQIAIGLEAAHEKGIVHRDLKPANIQLMGDGTVKILDFGLARAVDPNAEAQDPALSPTITAAMTQAGVVMGTAAYMSPEQARGRGVDARTDIWAFGCVLYEMLVGEQAYPGDTVSDVIAKILEREADLDRLPTNTPVNIRRLLRRCLSKDPADRLHHIADARLELDDFEAVESLATPVSSAKSSRLRFALPWLVTLALAVALGLTALRSEPESNTTVRFSIDPPGDTSMREFALSPDGTALAFVAIDRRGTSHLWLRRFEESAPELIPNADGLSYPFWSPDGTSLGFFQEGKLRRLDLATRTTQTLADAPNGRGAAWTEDDRILFTPEGLDVLYTVPADGGPATPLTRLRSDESFPEEATHRFPQIIPGTESLIYVTQDPEATYRTARSYLTTLSAPDQRKPIVTGLTEVYAPPGYLVFVRETTLIAQPFDRDRMELTGAATALATHISNSYPNTGRASFSVSNNGVLAYRSVVPPEAELVWFDRAGQRLEVLGEVGTYLTPSLSPDGRRLAYVRRTTDMTEVWVEDLERNATSRVAQAGEGTRINTPRWVSDDTLVYMMADGVYQKRVDRNDPPTVVWSASESDADEKPAVLMGGDYGNGSLMILANWDGQTDFDLWTLRPGEDSDPEVLVRIPGQQQDPSLSPDGKWVLYSSEETGRFEVYVHSVEDLGERRVVSSGGGQTPRWSPDGTEIYYVDPDFDLMAVSFQSQGGVTTGNPRRLFTAPQAAADLLANLNPSTDLMVALGDRFLFNCAVDAEASQRVDIVLNWNAELEQD